MKRIVLHLDRCYGCMSCEIACITAHKLPKTPITNQAIADSVSAETLDLTRIWVEASPDTNNPVPITCRHCLEAPCIDVCSIGALHRVDEENAVVNDEERCAGCWMCIMVCPFGAVEKREKVAVKCDLCRDRDSPACVEACPNEALEFVEVELLPLQERERFASTATRRE